MSFLAKFSYHFYPVGQGLFSTGSICLHDGNARFLWVYDCGTLSSQTLIDNGINQLNKVDAKRKRIDLFVLSHFDHDHISGIVRLLKDFKIGTLMLPYMPLAQRVIIAFEEGSGGADDLWTDFYLNPVAFLLEQAEQGIERILFVPPSRDEGPAYTGELPNPPETGSQDELKIDIDSDKPEDSEDAESLMSAGQQGGRKVEVLFLRPGSRITSASCFWEFIPYNDDPQDAIDDEFRANVANERHNLLSVTTSSARSEALKRLKNAYDSHFGRSSEERNVISLFLYSGPVYSKWETSWLTEGRSLAWDRSRRHHWPLPDICAWDFDERSNMPPRPRYSILYSGDGYLDTNERLQKLIKYLQEGRIRRIGVFQVMHHGAEANWHQGVAAAIAPLFSVFSSDPERKRWKHPHAPVLRDFWRYGAVQVDKNACFRASGYLSK